MDLPLTPVAPTGVPPGRGVPRAAAHRKGIHDDPRVAALLKSIRAATKPRGASK